MAKLRTAIVDWERTQNQIRELWFFWSAGLACLAMAVVCHRRGLPWLSVCLQAAGFAEMTWWTTPTFAFGGGAVAEFSRLLNNKLVFTVLALALLVLFWSTGILRPATQDLRHDVA